MGFTANSDRGYPGIFITFEGGDGAGKTTQLDLLCTTLAERGYEVVKLHEPGGTELGEQVRRLLLEERREEMDPHAELMLFEAARAQLVSQVIRPALEQGKVVVCDRFCDSTVAYQGYGRRLGAELVDQANRAVTQGLEPDRTILLKVPVQAGLARAKAASASGAGDRMEQAGAPFHERVSEAFDVLAREHAKRFVVIDARGTLDEVAAAVMQAIAPLLEKRVGARV
jgi:dTMP kinase